MTTDQLKTYIDNILNDTFKRLNYAYRCNNEVDPEDKKTQNEDKKPHKEEIKTRLIFPRKRDKTPHVSEQELRFAFVEAFIKSGNKRNHDLYYSIETPTTETYSFTGKGRRSGNFDVVIFNGNMQRVCLIEFKANNPDISKHKKDFEKLTNSKESKNAELRYFVEIVENDNSRTSKNLKEKLIKPKPGQQPIIVIAYSLQSKNCFINECITAN